MATPVRSDNPAVLCTSTKELLREDGMKEVDYCPICRDDYGILCRVARHPSTETVVAPTGGVNSTWKRKREASTVMEEGEYEHVPLSEDTKFFEFSEEYNSILIGQPSLPLRIFLRHENWEIARNLSAFLASGLRLFYLQGPPGAGKTKGSLLWMLQSIVKGSQAQNYPGPWAWIPLTKSAHSSTMAVYLLVKSDAGPNVIKFSKFATSDLYADLRDWGVKLIVFDNCNGENRSPVDTCASLGYKTIAVSSMQIKQDVSFAHGSYTVNGWKKEEYLEACEDAVFYDLVKAALQTGDFTEEELNDPNMRDEVVAAKYYLAGGSARWIFQFFTDQLLSSTGVDGIIDNLLTRLTPVHSKAEVNYMLTRIDGRPVIASQYVANCLVELFGETLLRSELLHLRGSSDPAMDDLLMEMEFVHRLGRSPCDKNELMIHLITHQGSDPISVFKSGGRMIRFRLSTFASSTFFMKDGDWFIPQVVNDGGFDCVQYRAGKLIFVQVTRSEPRSVNLKWHQKFRSAFVEKFPRLTIAECEVWFVVREDVLDTFEPAISSGTLTGYVQGNYKMVGMRRILA